MWSNKWVLAIFFAVVMAEVTSSSYSGNYCGDLEKKIWSIMVQKQDNDAVQLLPILFSECSMRGCDASVMIADINNKRGTIDREAILDRGFNFIAMIKDEVEETCPGLVVSFSDVLALATRDAIVMAGGPYYPVLTGRRDSEETFFDKAMAEEWLSMEDTTLGRSVVNSSIEGTVISWWGLLYLIHLFLANTLKILRRTLTSSSVNIEGCVSLCCHPTYWLDLKLKLTISCSCHGEIV